MQDLIALYILHFGFEDFQQRICEALIKLENGSFGVQNNLMKEICSTFLRDVAAIKIEINKK